MNIVIAILSTGYCSAPIACHTLTRHVIVQRITEYISQFMLEVKCSM